MMNMFSTRKQLFAEITPCRRIHAGFLRIWYRIAVFAPDFRKSGLKTAFSVPKFVKSGAEHRYSGPKSGKSAVNTGITCHLCKNLFPSFRFIYRVLYFSIINRND